MVWVFKESMIFTAVPLNFCQEEGLKDIGKDRILVIYMPLIPLGKDSIHSHGTPNLGLES
jgi:hypothetical protein